MDLKKKIIIIVSCFVVSIIGLISTFFVFKNTQGEANDNEKTGLPDTFPGSSIVFSYINESKSINLKEMVPTLDKFGILNEAFIFSIKNTSNIDRDFILKLVDENSTIKNNYVRYQLIKNDEVIGVFTLPEDGIIDIGRITPNEEIKYSLRMWLDFDSNIQVGTLNKHVCISESDIILDNSHANVPHLSEGMIPVYYDYSDSAYHKASQENSYYYAWYNYEKQNWANAVTVNSDKRKDYLESSVGTKIEMDDINSIWVWIPRFNYIRNNNTFNINFVKEEAEAIEAFSFNDKNLRGFWVSKFEAGMMEDSPCVMEKMTNICNDSNNKLYFKPGIPLAERMTMSNLFYAIRKMELKNNIYGFTNNGTKLNNDGTIQGDNNKIDTHMIKALEWQALGILTNSIYGKLGNNDFDNNNKYLYTNTTSMTGKAYYDKNIYDFNIQKNGTGASTTGNISGVYDLNGGKREYVMINNYNGNIFNKKSNSGFTSTVKNYYYDNLENKELLFTISEKDEQVINNEPLTRGGYTNQGDIFSMYGVSDYYNKISLQVNSRAVLIVEE